MAKSADIHSYLTRVFYSCHNNMLIDTVNGQHFITKTSDE